MQPQIKNKIADRLIAILFGGIVLLMVIAIIFRYFLNSSLYWSDEIVRYLFVWLSFLGAAIAIRDEAHIRVEYFVERLPEKWRRYIIFLDKVLFLLLLIFLVIAGFLWVFQLRGSLSPALGLPLNWIFYAALPVSCLLAIYYVLRDFRRGTISSTATKSKEESL